jgi:hypothetical protein
VYEIVARCEPHCDKDPHETSTRIRFVLCVLCCVCLVCETVIVLCYWIANFSVDSNLVWSTETKDWHQRFLANVQIELHNWWKCVGTKIPINVLYPLLSFSLFTHSLTHSPSLSLLLSQSSQSSQIVFKHRERNIHLSVHYTTLHYTYTHKLRECNEIWLFNWILLDQRSKSFETICQILDTKWLKSANKYNNNCTL